MPKLTKQELERASKGSCHDCGLWHPIYMVYDKLWKDAWPEFAELRKELHFIKTASAPTADPVRYRGLSLCTGCLERRLGRLLTVDDFTAAPVNVYIHLGYRMATHQRSTCSCSKQELHEVSKQ